MLISKNRGFMENCTQGYYECIEKALEEVGLRVEEIVKQGNKTVIIVLHNGAGEIPDKQRINNE